MEKKATKLRYYFKSYTFAALFAALKNTMCNMS